ncbi:hypothetical protein K353_06689, partial [Kitasatospora sp. SolWspMP-SS2h]
AARPPPPATPGAAARPAPSAAAGRPRAGGDQEDQRCWWCPAAARPVCSCSPSRLAPLPGPAGLRPVSLPCPVRRRTDAWNGPPDSTVRAAREFRSLASGPDGAAPGCSPPGGPGIRGTGQRPMAPRPIPIIPPAEHAPPVSTTRQDSAVTNPGFTRRNDQPERPSRSARFPPGFHRRPWPCSASASRSGRLCVHHRNHGCFHACAYRRISPAVRLLTRSRLAAVPVAGFTPCPVPAESDTLSRSPAPSPAGYPGWLLPARERDRRPSREHRLQQAGPGNTPAGHP